MKKIRINELARDLEIKANLILDKLPDFGVTEKKTHSSSVDEDVAEKLRDFFVGGVSGHDETGVRRSNGTTPHSDYGDSDHNQTAELHSAAESRTAVEQTLARPETSAALEENKNAQPAAETPVAEEERPPQRASLRPPLAPPLRPPMGGQRPFSPAPGAAQTPASQTPGPQTRGPQTQATPPATPAGTPNVTPAGPGPGALADAGSQAPGSQAPGSQAVNPTPASAHPRPAPPVRQDPPASVAPPRPGGPSTPGSHATPSQGAPSHGAPGAPVARPIPSEPSSPRPPAPQQTSQSGAHQIAPPPARPVPPEARPIPTAPPRPGQVLSGPRAPLPQTSGPQTGGPQTQGSQTPGAPAQPRPAMTPGAPRPMPQGPRPQSGQPIRPQGAQGRPGVAPGTPIAPRPPYQTGGQSGQQPSGPQAGSYSGQPAGQPMGQPGQGPRRPLVGQPAPRPVVPPRPDLVRKLTEQQRTTAPAQPAAPRPGMPQRPPQMPSPGRPIFPGGGARPGQPQRPGQAGQGAYMRTGPPGSRPGGGPRPMHPTSPRGPLGNVGLVPAPTPEQQRRPQARGGGRPQPRDREREAEGKLLRPMRREREQGPPPINRDITISEGVTVKELSEKLDVKANLVIKKLLDRGIFATINQTLDGQLATEMAREFGASTSTVTFEEEAMWEVEIAEEKTDLVRRPPVVTIMGHVDHGKTSLLDAIRTAKVAEREAGGITQHIGAYAIEKNGQKIVFIDTPGHEAFTRMRARGAKVTDVVVLVVAADDGVMPQTLEAIDHARAAKVPIVVAINKIDKADAQPDRIKQQLSDRGLLAEDWGGDVIMAPVSARTKAGLDNLLEMILLVAELQDLKANPLRPAMGSVIESKLDRGRGPVATVLVRNGTLRVGDFFICGQVFGKVRAMNNDRGEQLREAGPSMPVEVIGLDSPPDAGDEFQVVTDTAKAKQIVMYREEKTREEARAKNKRVTLEQFQKQMAAGETKELPLILKADVAGSAEVLSETLQKLSTDKVHINVIRSGVGAINEGDVLLASASEAIIIGFNVKPDRKAEATAEHEKVDIRLHSIIYNVTDELRKAMLGLLSPVFKEIARGKAEVRDTFRVSKVGTVAGCLVTEGNITRDNLLRLMRDGVAVHSGKVGSLKRFKDDVGEVRMGMECGITMDNYADYKVGDVFEAYITERITPDLGS